MDGKPSYSLFKVTATTKMLDKLNTLWYLASLPDFWIADVKLPESFTRIYNSYTNVIDYFMTFFAVFNAGSLLTQHNLSIEQTYDAISASTCLVTQLFRVVLIHYKLEVRKILYHLTVSLKEYNNIEIEVRMLCKLKRYTYVFISSSIISMAMRGVKGGLSVYRGGTFVTMITMWPDVHDPSLIAEITRYIIYVVWYIVLLQIFGTVLIVISMMIILSYQYTNLTSYFLDLNKIFKVNEMSQADKEKEFEKALVKGFKWHALTLWCVERCQHVCSFVFNTFLLFSPLLAVFLLPEMMKPEASTEAILIQLSIIIIVILALGLFMWNAGDITVEASKLPDGIYSSGWENCHGHSKVKIRKMILFAIQQAQRPVVLKGFGTFEMSYATYVTIMKSTYSFVSVLAI